MEVEDLYAVEEVDKAAFGPIWQNSYSGLELAYQQSAVSTVAEIGRKIIGYQISTATAMGGHLARLAVQPDFQGQGIGYELVQDLLAQFKRRGAMTVTVNTQHNNATSLSLYHRTGFMATGEEYPVYQYQIR
jgi:ribosomal-protein-alanine N-acetyltransferase